MFLPPKSIFFYKCAHKCMDACQSTEVDSIEEVVIMFGMSYFYRTINLLIITRLKGHPNAFSVAAFTALNLFSLA